MSGPVTRPTASALRRTVGLVRPHLPGSRWVALGGMAAVLLEVAARLLEPWPVKWVVDAVVVAAAAGAAGAATSATGGGMTGLLVGAAAAVVAVAGLRAVASYASTTAFAVVGMRVTTKLRRQVHERLLGAPLAYHDAARSGDLVTRVVSDVGRVQEAAVTAGLPLVANTVTVAGMLVVVAVIDPVLALVVVAVLPLLLLTGRRAAGRITTASRGVRKSEGRLAGDAGEAFAAVRTVQAYGLVAHLSAGFAGADRTGLREGVKAKRLAAGLERRTDVLVGVATGAVLLVGGHRVLSGVITPGELVVLLTYLKTALKPLRDLAKHVGRIARATASGERVADALDDAVPEPERSWARPLRRRPRGGGIAVELQDVRFERPGRGAVLDGAHLRVHPGEVVALVGPSGAGKSTVLQLLLRFLEPASGCVRLDGHDASSLTRDSVRAQTAVVLQDSALLAGTLADNVRLGRLDATDEEVLAALQAAGLGDLVASLPEGAATAVAERGSTLSGGQRQRVAVARALVRDPALVLLDEPTTGLDAASADAVLQALVRLAQGRTTLLVTHDERLLGVADRVVELRDGHFHDVRRRTLEVAG